jgi:NAD(P)-dependent dehydrogenase (short-subunit alcohol dehydrogenase family)
MMPSTLITGANRGLGLEFARQYLADGWQEHAPIPQSGESSPDTVFERDRGD